MFGSNQETEVRIGGRKVVRYIYNIEAKLRIADR